MNVKAIFLLMCLTVVGLHRLSLAAIARTFATVADSSILECSEFSGQSGTDVGCFSDSSIAIGRRHPFDAVFHFSTVQGVATVNTTIQNPNFDFDIVNTSIFSLNGVDIDPDDGMNRYGGQYATSGRGFLWDFVEQDDGSLLMTGNAQWFGSHYWVLRFDDVTLVPVPEPETLSLVAVLGLAVFAVRRDSIRNTPS